MIRTEILIVGSGGNGIALGARLMMAGRSDFVMISKHSDFGGTWFQNTYPGCEVDVPSPAYQFGFELNGDWSSLFAKQAELLAYMQAVAKRYGLYGKADFGTEMLAARWSEPDGYWIVDTNHGVYAATFLALATGFLEEAVLPPLEGIDEFSGPLFHSSEWPRDFCGDGMRVAVVGTGASAIQIVPELQKTSEAVFVFQRTPTWVIPKPVQLFDPQERERLRGSIEGRRELRRQAIEFREKEYQSIFLGADMTPYETRSLQLLKEQVQDPDLREKLTPKHRIGCKRPLRSNDFYLTLTQPNVTLVPEAVSRLGTDFVQSASGLRFQVDAVVFATGFYFGGHVLSLVSRRDGQSVADAHGGRPRAYKSINVSGCPNLFLVGGAAPNGQIWNGLACGELAADYMLQVMGFLETNRYRAFDVREDAQAEWKRKADEVLDLGPTVIGGCTNYSQDDFGHNKAAWPGSLANMTSQLNDFDREAYILIA